MDFKDILSDEEIQAFRIQVFEDAARQRYADFDDVVSPFAQSADEKTAKKIMSASDPAEAAYRMATAEPSLDDYIGGDINERPYTDEDRNTVAGVNLNEQWRAMENELKAREARAEEDRDREMIENPIFPETGMDV